MTTSSVVIMMTPVFINTIINSSACASPVSFLITTQVRGDADERERNGDAHRDHAEGVGWQERHTPLVVWHRNIVISSKMLKQRRTRRRRGEHDTNVPPRRSF